MSSLIDLVQRLRRRSVWQALGIYVVASWGVLQVVDTLAGALGLPDWLPSLALVLLLIGFPVVLATAFVQGAEGRSDEGEVGTKASPGDGAARAPEDDGDREEKAGTRVGSSAAALVRPDGPLRSLLTWKNAILGGVGAFALWGVVAAGWLLVGGTPLPRADAAQRTGVAVLPFENMAAESENQAFVSGVHDDVLTHLSKVDELRVVSRTSVMKYRDTEMSLPEIADELGVGYILEGSVQRSRDRVRLNAQLIDARGDEHVWAEIYDRTLTPENVFSIQSDLARSIASALDAELTPEEERRIEDRPTDELAAYDLLNRGRELYLTGREEHETAVELFRQALEMDPDFALAHAWLGNAYGQRVQTYGFPQEWADSGLARSRRALEIEPELAQGWKALALNLDHLGRIEEAKRANLRALEIEPSFATPTVNLAATAGFQGACHRQWAWALRARELNPNSAFAPLHVGVANHCLGRFDEAEEWFQRSLDLDPDFDFAIYGRVLNLLAQDRYEEALEVAGGLTDRVPGSLVGLVTEAMAAHMAGRRELARQRYEEILRRAPEWDFNGLAAYMRSALGHILIQEGRVEEGRGLAEEALARASEAVERGSEFPVWHIEVAGAHAVLGHRTEALAALAEAADAGAWRAVHLVRDPRFEELRDAPRFRETIDRIRGRLAEQRRAVEADTVRLPLAR